MSAERVMRAARRWIWTMPEIHTLGEFGTDHGWFFGFVDYEGRIGFGEVFPGMGYAECLPYPWWSLREWYMAARDVLLAKPRLTANVGRSLPDFATEPAAADSETAP